MLCTKMGKKTYKYKKRWKYRCLQAVKNVCFGWCQNDTWAYVNYDTSNSSDYIK